MPKVLSGAELAARGYMDLTDRGGVIAQKCSFCGGTAGPFDALPVLNDPTGRMRGHLVRSRCAICRKAGKK